MNRPEPPLSPGPPLALAVNSGWSKVCLAACAAVFGALALLTIRCEHPAVREFAALDFYPYYYAALAIRHGENPYAASWCEARAAADAVPYQHGSDFLYPAPAAVLVAPLTLLGPKSAAALWILLSCALALGVIGAAFRRAHPAWMLAAGLFVPLLFSLFVGQMNVVVLALLFGGWKWRDSHPRFAGAALGLAALFKVMPALLLVWFLITRRREAAIAMIGTVIAVMTLTTLLLPGSTSAFLTTAMARAAVTTSSAHPVNQGVQALFTRLFVPNRWTDPWVAAPALVLPATWLTVAVLVGVALRRWSRRGRTDSGLYATLIALGVIGSPLAWESLFTWFLVPIGLAVESRGPRLPILAALAMFVVQRGLDGFANAPESYPFLRALPLAASWGLAAGILLTLSFAGLRDRGS